MKKYLLVFLINIVLALFQCAFLPAFFSVTATANLVFAFALGILLNNKSDLGLFSVLIGGLFVDFFVNRIPGVSSLFGSIVLYGLYLLRSYFFRGRTFVFVYCTVCFYIAQMIMTANYSLDLGLLLSALFTSILGFLLARLIYTL